MKTQHTSPEDKAVVRIDAKHIPDDIPILPLDNQVAFPKTNMSLAVPMDTLSLIETEALHRSLGDLAREIFSLSFSGPDEAVEKLTRINDPLHLSNVAAAYIEIDFETRQALLEEDSLKAKLCKLLKAKFDNCRTADLTL